MKTLAASFVVALGVMAAAVPAIAQDTKTQVMAGQINTISDTNLTLKALNGKSYTYTFSDSTQFRTLKNAKAKASDLKKNGNCIVFYTEADSKMTPTLVYQAETVQGKINKVNENNFTLTDNDSKTWTFKLPSSMQVSDSAGTSKKLSDIAGQNCTVWYYQDDSSYICPAIQVRAR